MRESDQNFDSVFIGGKYKTHLCILLFVGVVACGTLGYRLIEDWDWSDAFYMTVITVSTVGFGETHPLSTEGRMFTAALIIFGVGIVAYGIAGIVESIVQRQFRLFSRSFKTQRIISKMKKHIIVCGCGKMGEAIIQELLDDGIKNVVIIESDPIKAQTFDEHKIPVVNADATLEKTLAKAGIDNADALVATLDGDAENLFLVLTARSMNPKLKIIARAESENNRKKFIQAGADKTVSPYAAGARRMFSLLTAPGINDLADALQIDRNTRFTLDTMDIGEDDQFNNKTLAEARLRDTVGGLVVAIRRKDNTMLFNPQSSIRMTGGDRLYIIRFSVRTT